MFVGNNLKSFFFGGTKSRELRETYERWEETEALWRASPLAKADLAEFTRNIVLEAAEAADQYPSVSVLTAVHMAILQLYEAEDIGAIEPLWSVIETDVKAAVSFRELIVRRRRWAADFERVNGAFRRIVRGAIDQFFKALPTSCFDHFEDGPGDTFEVRLIDLIDDPEALVNTLFMLPYDDDTFRLDIFQKLCELCVGNLLVASGFLRTADFREHESKLVLPPQQKNKSPAELAELYLGGSPLKELTELPVPFRIPEAVRFEHCHIIGGTGHGKTQLMQKLIHADLVASMTDYRSVIVIDSQGDLINKVSRLDLFSPDKADSLADRLVLIDPSDVEFPAALNLFDAHLDRIEDYSAADRERVLNGVVELYELFFGAFLGAELTQKQGVIFKYLARLMLAIPNATIHTLMRIMEDGKAFKPYMERLDGSARYFFETEFFQPSFAATKKQVLRRLWGVLSTPAFERLFTQPKNKLDLFEAMNGGKIILVNTAKDLLKREGSQLFGRFFIAMITQAALERSTLPERHRTPTFVYVDEAQEYFDDSIETILNQARKYNVGLTIAHQTLDQLTPRLRSVLLANTSTKCAGGVSARDARALAEELRTTAEFIEGMKRRGDCSEFALWVKHLTGQAIRLTVPLGFLERQPTLTEEEYDALLKDNRVRHCGTLADVPKLVPHFPQVTAETGLDQPTSKARAQDAPPSEPSRSAVSPAQVPEPAPERPTIASAPHEPLRARTERPPINERELGKGGPKHRYLQALVKELAEQHGFKATIEAPLSEGQGQVDVLIERDGVIAAVEVSVTTPVEHERDNLRKCLTGGYPRIAVILAKTKTAQTAYRTSLLEVVAPEDREKVSFLTPEELPDYIASLVPPAAPSERVVKGYKVKGSITATSPEDARVRREAVARLIARSLADQRSRDRT